MLKKIPQSEWHKSQRGYFAGALYNAMVDDPDIWLVVGDLGYGIFDKIQQDFPERYVNVGASEQAGVGICVGLALENKKPFFYTITPFFMRALETINIYLSHEGAPVILVGSGRDDDYKHDGYSHDATVSQDVLGKLNIDQYYPDTPEVIPGMLKMIVKNKKPSFISLKRG